MYVYVCACVSAHLWYLMMVGKSVPHAHLRKCERDTGMNMSIIWNRVVSLQSKTHTDTHTHTQTLTPHRMPCTQAQQTHGRQHAEHQGQCRSVVHETAAVPCSPQDLGRLFKAS